MGSAAEGELRNEAKQEEGGEEGGHEEAKEALRKLGVEGMVEGRALEGYWE